MSETVEGRLKEASESCTKAYKAWFGNQQDAKAREALQDAVHELRRVAARLEIDIAHSESKSRPNRPSHNDEQNRARKQKVKKPKVDQEDGSGAED